MRCSAGLGSLCVATTLACVWPARVWGQLEVVPDDAPQAVFGGGPRNIRVSFRNRGDAPVQAELLTRLFQLSSATSMPLGAAQPWRTLQVLPGQTVLEAATLTFPAVRAATRLQIQWLDARGTSLGRTEVVVYPDNLLKQLAPLAGDKPLGVFDPDDQLKPTLKRLEIEFDDLESGLGLSGFAGKLAVIGPFSSPRQIPADLRERVVARAKDGLALVWIEPPDRHRLTLAPSARVFRAGAGAVVVAHATTVAALADSPLAQLNLVRLATMALHPEPSLRDWIEPPTGKESP